MGEGPGVSPPVTWTSRPLTVTSPPNACARIERSGVDVWGSSSPRPDTLARTAPRAGAGRKAREYERFPLPSSARSRIVGGAHVGAHDTALSIRPAEKAASTPPRAGNPAVQLSS